MPRSFLVLLAALFAATASFGCGSSGGSPTRETPEPPGEPTVTSVVPNRGPLSGSTPTTITGTNFLAGSTVLVGNTPATGIIVVDATTITCSTPAGPAGTVDVEVATTQGSDRLHRGFTYDSAPIIASVAPKPGTTAGGTPITILGANFVVNNPGPNTVTIGGAPCAAVVTVDDNTITCTTPAGVPGVANVVVTNINGADTLVGGYAYAVPLLYVAEGGGVTANLTAINPVTLAITPIGPVGFSVTGLALGPDGTIYGAEAVPGTTAARRLLTIDPLTGAGTAVGVMVDAGARNHAVPGMTFSGGALISVSGPTGAGQTVQIDPTTGGVTVVAPTPSAPGGGLATDPATGTVYYGTAVAGTLQVLNPTNGLLLAGPALTGGTWTYLAALTYLGGTLYAVDKAPGPGTAANLVSINTTTGAITFIMTLPIDINAIVNSVH